MYNKILKTYISRNVWQILAIRKENQYFNILSLEQARDNNIVISKHILIQQCNILQAFPPEKHSWFTGWVVGPTLF